MAKMNKELIAINLLTTGSLQECAEKSNIGIATLHRLRKKPEFQELVKQTKKEMFGECMSKAQAGSIKALNVLNDIMEDTEATDSSRVSAARTVLELGLNSSEQEEILTKLSELERRLKS